HEPGAVHRLDRRADRRTVTLEPLRQTTKTVDFRRRRADLDGRALTVEVVEVETLTTEIQSGVQHRSGPPLRWLPETNRSLSPGKPFFMAFLPLRSGTVAMGCHWLPIRLFFPLFGPLAFATDCHRLR